MSCDKCSSVRILGINAKCSDLFGMTYKNEHGTGYVPTNLIFGKDGFGDYVEIDFCLDCGKIQGQFPIAEDTVEEAMNRLDHPNEIEDLE
jgi:hypothetical protein